MSLKDKLAELSGQNISLDELLLKVKDCLLATDLIVPSAGKSNDGSMKFITGEDKLGREWLYAYTDKEEILKVFPKGCSVVEAGFKYILDIAILNEKFAGIFINSSLPVPRECFEMLK